MLVKDPVCGMEIESNSAVAQEQYKGKTFHFCSQACKESFVAEPEKFVDAEDDRP